MVQFLFGLRECRYKAARQVVEKCKLSGTSGGSHLFGLQVGSNVVRLGSLALLVLIQWLSENRRKVKGNLRDAKWSGTHTHPQNFRTCKTRHSSANDCLERLEKIRWVWPKDAACPLNLSISLSHI